MTQEETISRVGLLLLTLDASPESRRMLHSDPLISNFLRKYIETSIRSLSPHVVARDRTQVFKAMEDVLESRKLKMKIGEEKVNLKAYEAILEDLRAVHRQLECPQAIIEEVSPTSEPLPHNTIKNTEGLEGAGQESSVGTPAG